MSINDELINRAEAQILANSLVRDTLTELRTENTTVFNKAGDKIAGVTDEVNSGLDAMFADRETVSVGELLGAYNERVDQLNAIDPRDDMSWGDRAKAATFGVNLDIDLEAGAISEADLAEARATIAAQDARLAEIEAEIANEEGMTVEEAQMRLNTELASINADRASRGLEPLENPPALGDPSDLMGAIAALQQADIYEDDSVMDDGEGKGEEKNFLLGLVETIMNVMSKIGSVIAAIKSGDFTALADLFGGNDENKANLMDLNEDGEITRADFDLDRDGVLAQADREILDARIGDDAELRSAATAAMNDLDIIYDGSDVEAGETVVAGVGGASPTEPGGPAPTAGS